MDIPSIEDLLLEALESATTLHKLWLAACEEKTVDGGSMNKCANLFRAADNAKDIFRRLAVPVKWDYVKDQYVFDIPCPLQMYLYSEEIEL